jgi:hypothetical protein
MNGDAAICRGILLASGWRETPEPLVFHRGEGDCHRLKLILVPGGPSARELRRRHGRRLERLLAGIGAEGDGPA